jgi:hypothetical protein
MGGVPVGSKNVKPIAMVTPNIVGRNGQSLRIDRVPTIGSVIAAFIYYP